MLEIGHKAPNFHLPANNGKQTKLADFQGKSLVLYFYPKDGTPGCTTEAKDFTTLKRKFSANGAAVLGISKDSLAKHQKFKDKHEITILLGADEDGKVCETYDVWVEKKNYGRTYMGIERTTFLIDKNGKIADIWRKVRVKGHAEAVLEQAKALK